MDETSMRRLLGALAGGLAGVKAGRQEPLGGFAGGLLGGVSGLFAADMLNALSDLATSQSNDTTTVDKGDYEAGYACGYMLGLSNMMAMVVSLVEGLGINMGVTIDNSALAKVRDERQLCAFLRDRQVRILRAYEASLRDQLVWWRKQWEAYYIELPFPIDIEEEVRKQVHAFAVSRFWEMA